MVLGPNDVRVPLNVVRTSGRSAWKVGRTLWWCWMESVGLGWLSAGGFRSLPSRRSAGGMHCMLLIDNDDGLWSVWDTVLGFHLVGYMALAILQPFRKISVLMGPFRM